MYLLIVWTSSPDSTAVFLGSCSELQQYRQQYRDLLPLVPLLNFPFARSLTVHRALSGGWCLAAICISQTAVNAYICSSGRVPGKGFPGNVGQPYT